MENNIVITNDSFAKLEKKKTVEISVERQSVWKDIWKELKKNKVAMVSVVLLAILIIAVLLAPLSPYDPYKLDASQKLQGISSSHWFGTDEYGRDYFTRTLYGGRVSLLVGFMSMIMTVVIGTSLGVFSGYVGGKVDMFLMSFTDIFLALPSMLYGRDYFTRTLYGGRVSLLVGFMSMIMTVVIGTSLGVFSGYVGGKVDMFLMSFTDIFLALPSMLLMVILNTFLKPGLPTLIVVLSLFSWASVARITRAETMSLKERDFVVATQNLGASNFRVIIKHIIPNILGPVIVAASLSVANAILMESSLSFLGLGVQIPRASWGSMLQGAQAHILDYPLLAVYPGVMILITVLSFNLLGDILRNALEPKIVE